MRFEIENVLAIRSAEIDVGPVDGGKGPGITLITAPNEGGKTVLRNAMAAPLTGTYALYGTTKDTGKKLVANGAEHGIARAIYSDDEGVQVTWPNCQVKLKGSPEMVDKLCVGWDTPLDLKGKAWVDWLSKVAGVDADSEEVLAGITTAAPISAEIVKQIKGLGWDGAAAEYAQRATAERSAWAKLTGQRWGSNLMNPEKALWSHADLDPRLDLASAKADLAKLQEDAALARAKAKAITPEERGKLRAEAAKLDQLSSEHVRHVAEAQEIGREMMSAKTVYTCPACDALLKIVAGKLVHEDESAQIDVEALRDRKSKILIEANRIMDDMGKAREAAHRLAEAEKIMDSKATDGLAPIQARIERLDYKVRAAHVTAEAKTLAESAIALQRLAEFLSPGGYRRDLLVEALGKPDDPESFMARLGSLTGLMFGDRRMSWIATEQEDMPCLLGEDLDWRDMSWAGDASSSMLRVRAALQILHAERVGAPCVLIDMVDTLAGPVRQAFFQAIVRYVKVPVVLFCSLAGAPPEEDALAKAGLGRTYVIGADGVVRGV